MAVVKVACYEGRGYGSGRGIEVDLSQDTLPENGITAGRLKRSCLKCAFPERRGQIRGIQVRTWKGEPPTIFSCWEVTPPQSPNPKLT